MQHVLGSAGIVERRSQREGVVEGDEEADRGGEWRKGRKMTARLSNGSIYLLAVGIYRERGSRYVYRRWYNRAEKWLGGSPRVSGRKMCCGMRAARRRFRYPLLPCRPFLTLSLSPLSFYLAPTLRQRLLPLAAASFAEKIVFISTVVRMDSVLVIYVPAQTHLIYSAEHNSLTLFREKCSYILVTPPSNPVCFSTPLCRLRMTNFP